jgi:hypothetical protein
MMRRRYMPSSLPQSGFGDFADEGANRGSVANGYRRFR